MTRALVLGVGGQVGSYLADILLEKGVDCHGLYRRSSLDNLRRVRHIQDRITLHQGDVLDQASFYRIVQTVHPDLIFNEADQDNVGWSYNLAGYACDVTAGAVGKMLEILRHLDHRNIRFFQPVTAMMFGDPTTSPQNEETPFNPQSPYACAKTMAYHLCRYYRQTHGMFVSTAICFNHDSPRRGDEYLLHKICEGAVRIARGRQETLPLGNVEQRVDIGYAREYAEAAYDILQLDWPDDFVIGTGTAWTIREMVAEAFRVAGVRDDPASLLTIDSRFYRPGVAGNTALRADATKAWKAFGFQPRTDIKTLIGMLVEHAWSAT